VTNVTVSDVSWDSFLLSWSAEDGAFEAFLIEVIDAETGDECQNHTVPANARYFAVSGLSSTTWYRASLYGVHRGALVDPVFADTITGITAVDAGGLSLSSASFFCRTQGTDRCVSAWTFFVTVNRGCQMGFGDSSLVC